MCDFWSQCQCSLQAPIDELELLAAADNEASDAVRAHLAVCPVCTARVRMFAVFQQQLRTHLFRALCPSSEELGAYHKGELAPEQHGTIRDHLQTCVHCAAEYQLLSTMLTTLPFSTMWSTLAAVRTQH